MTFGKLHNASGEYEKMMLSGIIVYFYHELSEVVSLTRPGLTWLC